MKIDFLGAFETEIAGQKDIMFDYVLNGIYIVLSLYLLTCSTKGNDFFGYRYSCFTFYAVT